MEKVTVGTVTIDREEINNVVDALKNKMLSVGEYLDKFEETFPGYYGKKRCVMVNSGQSAIEVAVEYALLGAQDSVVAVPAMTYMATIWGAMRQDAELAFFDVKLSDYGINLEVEGFNIYGDIIKPNKVDIALPADLFGKKCNLARLDEHTTVIEDACESVGNGACNYGEFICFSFYASHIMSTGGSGAIVFDEEKAEHFIRSYIAHGRSHGGDFTKNTGKFMDRFIFERYGQSLRSDNIHAAIAMAQYSKVMNIIRARIDNGKRITKNLQELSSIAKLASDENNVFMFYPLLVDSSSYHVLDLMSFLYDNRIDSRRLMPVVTQPAFKNEFPDLEPEMFPMSLLCSEKGILLGCHQDLTADQIDFMCEKILQYFSMRREI